MTVTMTPIVTKITSMADSFFDSNSTDFGGRCTYIPDFTRDLHNEIWPTGSLHDDTVIAVRNNFFLRGHETEGRGPTSEC
jgi:hypothetical protein